MSILGNRVLRKEDPKFLTTGGTYVDDLPLPGAAYVTYVRSTMAHATITSIDTTEAKKAAGVLGIYTADDIDLEPMTPGMPMINMGMVRPFLANGVEHWISVSVGVATVPGHQSVAPHDLIQEADSKLYEAKAAGRNCVRP